MSGHNMLHVPDMYNTFRHTVPEHTTTRNTGDKGYTSQYSQKQHAMSNGIHSNGHCGIATQLHLKQSKVQREQSCSVVPLRFNFEKQEYEVLLIKQRHGHWCLPRGHASSEDISTRDTAIRGYTRRLHERAVLSPMQRAHRRVQLQDKLWYIAKNELATR